jgi:NAD(P)-dependent dehydrogenase (short-subunit alcohol dehydrogenase family)
MAEQTADRTTEETRRIGIGPEALRLDGQVALITGASKNIGAAIAGSYAAAGADVLMVARGAEQLAATAEAIRRQSPGRRIETLVADVSQPEGIERLADEALAAFGRIDILVNNAYHAGLDENRNVLEVSDGTWDAVLAANLLGPLRLTRRLVPAMLEAGGGSVINLVSGSGLLPNSAPGHLPAPTMAPYGVTKAALWMLTRYLSAELAPQVRVNALCPGLVAERGTTRDEEPYERLIRLGAVPMNRIGGPEEIAGAAVYLASPAASYTTGEILICNGGRAW